MGLLDFLSGANQIGEARGFDIKKEDFQIKDADKLFGQTQEQFQTSKQAAEQARQRQNVLFGQLERQALGQGPSLAVEQMKAAQEKSLAQQLAAAQAQRGAPTAALQRQLFRQGAESQQALNRDAAQARIAEQQASQEMYAQALSQQAQQVNDLTQKYLQQGFDIRSAEQQALEDYNKLQVEQNLGIQQINAQNQQQRGSMIGGLTGGLLSGIASGGASLIGSLGAKSAANKLAQQQTSQLSSGLQDWVGKQQEISGPRYDFSTPTARGLAGRTA